VSVSYNVPYGNRALTQGITVGGGYLQKRELPIKINYNDSLIFYPSNPVTRAKSEFVYKSWFAHAGYTLRRGFFKKHIFTVSYTYIKIADSVILDKQYNPNYFKEPVNSKGIIDFVYSMQYANVNNGTYPLKGETWFTTVQKRG